MTMIGVTISDSSYSYGEIFSVIHNYHPHESTFKKKSNYIFYHAVCESVSIGEPLTENVGTNENCADISTKVMCGGKGSFHVSNLLYNIYDLCAFV